MSNEKYLDSSLFAGVRSTMVAIELLDMEEKPIGRIDGEVINGNITVDGDSSVRRVCNLTFVSTEENYKILETYNNLSPSKKIKVEVLVTDLEKKEKQTETFKCGVFIMTKCTSVVSTSQREINIVAQDKMCLHNGEIGGKVSYVTRFDTEVVSAIATDLMTSIEQGLITAREFPYKVSSTKLTNILPNSIEARRLKQNYQSSKTKPSTDNSILNTIIGDLDSLYSIVDRSNLPISNTLEEMKKTIEGIKDIPVETILDSPQIYFYYRVQEEINKLITMLLTINEISPNRKIPMRELIRYAAITYGGEAPGRVIISDIPDLVKSPVIIKKASATNSEEIGFKMVEYVYPDELTLAPGTPVVQVYEKCNEALGGNFEYFYDLDGNFIFQEIKNYYNNTMPDIKDLKSEDYLTSFERTPVQFDFSNYDLGASYVNSPSWANVKNDLYVWGDSGKETLGYHLAIDEKIIIPDYISVHKDYNQDQKMDWREYIYHTTEIGDEYVFLGKEVVYSETSVSRKLLKKFTSPLFPIISGNFKNWIYLDNIDSITETGISSLVSSPMINDNTELEQYMLPMSAQAREGCRGMFRLTFLNQAERDFFLRNRKAVMKYSFYEISKTTGARREEKIYESFESNFKKLNSRDLLFNSNFKTFNLFNSTRFFDFTKFRYEFKMEIKFTGNVKFGRDIHVEINDMELKSEYNESGIFGDDMIVIESSNKGYGNKGVKYFTFKDKEQRYRNGYYHWDSWQSWKKVDLETVKKSIVTNPYYNEIKSFWMPQMFDKDFIKKESPKMNFYIDIIEGNKELSKFSIPTIGRRREVIEDKNIKQLYPTIIEEKLVYYEDGDIEYTTKPDNAIMLEMRKDFINYPPAGNIYKDAFSSIKDLLFRKTVFNEQVVLTSAPLYELEVNRRVYAYSEKASVNGYYLVKKIALNLDPSGIMTVTMFKTEQRDR